MTALSKMEDPQLPAEVSQTTALISMIERAAMNPAVDIDKMERLLAMQERMLAKQAEVAFNDAMGEAQTKVRRIAADKQNKQTNSSYASYAALDRELRPIYTDAGFSLSFDTGDAPSTDLVRVVCYVSHKAGHTRTYKIDMPADGKGARGNDVMTKTHATGSAMQYGMRYLLKAIFNVAIGNDPADDDGNKAGKQEAFMSEQHVVDIEARCAAIGPKILPRVLNSYRVERLDDIADSEYQSIITKLANTK